MQQGNDEDKNNMHSKGKKETIVYQLNPSSQLLFEDALKRCLNKYGGKKVPLKTPYAPRNHNSPFGDFPKSYLPKKKFRLQLNQYRITSNGKCSLKLSKCQKR